MIHGERLLSSKSKILLLVLCFISSRLHTLSCPTTTPLTTPINVSKSGIVASSVYSAGIGLFALAVGSFPKNFVKTLTFDNGLEFAKHHALRDFFDFKTFFCDPHSPWQKPQVENVNRLIHNLLNHRPRKCLNFKTPHEVFYELVALRP